MAAMSIREKVVLSIVGMVLLYLLTVSYWFLFQRDAWKKAAREYARAHETYESECRLISERQRWNQAYEDEKALMPTFESGKATETTWQRKMEEIAQKNHISISQRQVGKEVEAGDVYELSIDVKSCEGALESMVKFLHELENTDEGMFDIRMLSLRPSSKRGYLKGSFTVTCAYMREK